MLNLRRSNKSEQSSFAGSDVKSLSRFSVTLRIPSDLLGNIGEALDHKHSKQLPDDVHADGISVMGSDAPETPPFMPKGYSTPGEGSATTLGDPKNDLSIVSEVPRDAPEPEPQWDGGQDVSSRACTA